MRVNTWNLRLVAIGASAGGVSAVRHILRSLDEDFRVPIVVVQHLPPKARLDVGLIYGSGDQRRILEAEDKMIIRPGHVYMAAPGYHLLVERGGWLALSQDEAVNHSRPSIDVFFASAARAYGSRLAGIVLTGANSDGALGLSYIKAAGGLTLVQDPAEAEHDPMPVAAIRNALPHRILNLDGIANVLSTCHFDEATAQGEIQL